MVNETAFNCTNVQRAITSSEEVKKFPLTSYGKPI